jgi:hypothetical protein
VVLTAKLLGHGGHWERLRVFMRISLWSLVRLQSGCYVGEWSGRVGCDPWE